MDFRSQVGGVAALKMMGGHTWTTDGEWQDVEVRSPGRRNGVVCEVALEEEVGSFADFSRQILTNRIEFDPRALRLVYHSARVGVLGIDGEGSRTIDGEQANLDYPTFDSPYLYSAWDSGVIRATCGNESLTLDFQSPADKADGK